MTAAPVYRHYLPQMAHHILRIGLRIRQLPWELAQTSWDRHTPGLSRPLCPGRRHIQEVLVVEGFPFRELLPRRMAPRCTAESLQVPPLLLWNLLTSCGKSVNAPRPGSLRRLGPQPLCAPTSSSLGEVGFPYQVDLSVPVLQRVGLDLAVPQFLHL